MKWEIVTPLTSEAVLGLIDSGVPINGTITLELESDDPAAIEQVEKVAAGAGLMLVRVE